MMKKVCSLLLALMCLCSAAAAQPRYPGRQGHVTDAAAVLSPSTAEELAAFAEKVEDATSMDFWVATVDFLDGETLKSYGEGLREAWGLGDDDLLLLLVVGEDRFGSFGGEDVNRQLSVQVQEKLLSSCLEEAFLRQQYDEALCRYIPALTNEISKACGEKIDISGLFGQAEQNSINWTEEWTRRWDEAAQQTRQEERPLERVTREDKDTGFSLGKVILTIYLLSVLFGKRGRRRGCLPCPRFLAGLGLWKLWGKDR